eukprot:CAMPEP_0114352376 /NCGR_PEP_ID=MMETSP0101-20121206/17903_1 /TAXON_ID=38822 ORGANISM="Pteridomonas danica, Strain PT" /NCGR_SAMPLE_ID=MMETSP0101 /ASSEMBLY_ACC=CAM_ASM_000211 /LENGTH=183 /DNA_ID=CAMNT_0001492753 /DNA_START=53 /DNA_END=601 /DNA_ORIENTATION=+
MQREDDYNQCAQTINRAINEMVNASAPLGRRNAALSGATETIREAEIHIEHMELEAGKIVGPNRSSSMSKVRKFKADLGALKREVNKSAKVLESNPTQSHSAELFSNSKGNAWDVASSSESLQNSTKLLEDSRRIVAETEEIGDAVAGDLESQRHQLLNAHGQVMNMKTLTDDARRILKEMSW